MTTRRFEFRDAKSAKFWAIEVVEHRTITTWGRVGTDGQTRAKEFASAAKAIADADKKVAEKLKKGYTETNGSISEADLSDPVAAPASGESADRSLAAQVATSGEVAVGGLDNVKPVPEPSFGEMSFTAAWRKRVLPRRDRASAGFPLTPKPNPGRGQSVMALALEPERNWTASRAESAGLSATFTQLLLEEPEHLNADDNDHVAAAALRTLVATRTAPRHRCLDKDYHFIVDHWVAQAGLAFAVRAVEETHWWLLPSERQVIRSDTPTSDHIERRTDRAEAGFWSRMGELGSPRLRHYIALATGDEYETARKAADDMRALTSPTAWRMAYLFPHEPEWVADALARRQHMFRAATANPLTMISTAADLDQFLMGVRSVPRIDRRSSYDVATLLDTFGSDLVPYLSMWLRGEVSAGNPAAHDMGAETRKGYVQALRIVGTDEALRALIPLADHKHVLPGLTDFAMERPHGAVRVLAEFEPGAGSTAKAIARLLRQVVLAHPGAAATELAALSRNAERRVRAAADRSEEKVTAPAELVPTLLAKPPWNNRVSVTQRVIVADLEMISPSLPDSLPSSESPPIESTPADSTTDWAERTTAILADPPPGTDLWRASAVHVNYFERAPVDVIRTMLPHWRFPGVGSSWQAERVARALVGRLGDDALPALEYLAEARFTAVVGVIEGIAAPELAMPFANAFYSLKSMREPAARWLEANAEVASYGLIPHAVGEDTSEQRAAADALRHIARSHRDTVGQVATSYGVEVLAAVNELLSFDESQILPKRMPKLPDFISLDTMTLPLLADRQHQLPISATESLVLMLAISKPSEPYAGIERVIPSLDPASTATFAWELFESWQGAGMPSKTSWILTAQGLLGDDETVRRLTPIIRAWPGEGGHKRAVNGLDALADIGSDLALMQLFGMSRKLKFKGLKNKAAEKVAQIADQRALTADQLADRLVPDLDLNSDGSRLLDYGSRTFTVGFDEQLKPFVRDETGKVRKALPKPAQKDDPELAPHAYKEFAALKKDARALASDQLVRLEQAMVRQRRWTNREFAEYFVDHPLIIHLVRRLVWGVYQQDSLVASFRVAEDRSLADASDGAFILADDATVGIVHPLDMDPALLASWGEVLSDYEMLQPFQQVARETFEMTPDELESTLFTRFNGPLLSFGKYLGLEKKGWVRGTPQDAGICPNLYRAASDVVIHIELESGLLTGYIQETPDQSILGVSISTSGAGWYSRSSDLSFTTLSPIVISELLRDLTDLFA